jgi:hypothetical protein
MANESTDEWYKKRDKPVEEKPYSGELSISLRDGKWFAVIEVSHDVHEHCTDSACFAGVGESPIEAWLDLRTAIHDMYNAVSGIMMEAMVSPGSPKKEQGE